MFELVPYVDIQIVVGYQEVGSSESDDKPYWGYEIKGYYPNSRDGYEVNNFIEYQYPFISKAEALDSIKKYKKQIADVCIGQCPVTKSDYCSDLIYSRIEIGLIWECGLWSFEVIGYTYHDEYKDAFESEYTVDGKRGFSTRVEAISFAEVWQKQFVDAEVRDFDFSRDG